MLRSLRGAASGDLTFSKLVPAFTVEEVFEYNDVTNMSLLSS